VTQLKFVASQLLMAFIILNGKPTNGVELGPVLRLSEPDAVGPASIQVAYGELDQQYLGVWKVQGNGHNHIVGQRFTHGVSPWVRQTTSTRE